MAVKAWTSFAMAPAVAAIQVGAGYALVKPACASGHVAPLLILAAGLAVTGGAGAYLGWRSRARFIGAVGATLNVLVLVLILASSLGLILESPCQ
jgi:hypothetical protein